MTRAERIALGVLLLAAGDAASAAGSVSGGFGWRQLDDKRWERLGVDSQAAVQLNADVRLGASPWYVNVGALLSADDLEAPSQNVYDGEIAVVDLSAGLKWMPDTGMLKPYLEGGLASAGIALEYEDSSNDDVDDSDQSFGGFVGTGAQLRVSRHLVGTLSLRWLFGTEAIEVGGIRGDLDSFSALLGFGYAWGGD